MCVSDQEYVAHQFNINIYSMECNNLWKDYLFPRLNSESFSRHRCFVGYWNETIFPREIHLQNIKHIVIFSNVSYMFYCKILIWRKIWNLLIFLSKANSLMLVYWGKYSQTYKAMVIHSKSLMFLLPYIKNIMEEEKIFFGMQPLTLISLLQTHPLNNNESTMYYRISKPSFSITKII